MPTWMKPSRQRRKEKKTRRFTVRAPPHLLWLVFLFVVLLCFLYCYAHCSVSLSLCLSLCLFLSSDTHTLSFPCKYPPPIIPALCTHTHTHTLSLSLSLSRLSTDGLQSRTLSTTRAARSCTRRSTSRSRCVSRVCGGGVHWAESSGREGGRAQRERERSLATHIHIHAHAR